MATRGTTKATAKAVALKITPIGDFKARLGGIMELPSGDVMKLRNPGGLQAFMANGTIPNSLLAIIDQNLNGGDEETRAAQAQSIAKDPEKMSDMTKLIDSVTMQTVVEPKIQPKPESEEARLDDVLYIDEVADIDKQFIFKWVSGGVRDLAQFRQQTEGSVAPVPADKKPAAKSTRSAGARNG